MAFFDTTWYINFGDGSTTGYYAVPVWPGALAAVTAGTWCRQLAAPTVGNERCFVCVTAGTTGAAEPVWVVTRGADSAANIDGTVKWMECTGMAGPNADLTNAPVWVASRVITLGEVYYDSVSGSLQAATTAGTSKSGAAPSFSATAGVTTADNTVTWTSLGPTSNYTTPFKYPHARAANAFTATWGAAGNQFGISSIHAETQSTAITLNAPGTLALPCSVYCISNSTTLANATLSTAGTISTTGVSNITFASATSFAYYYGLTFSAGNSSNSASIILGNTNAVLVNMESCTLKLNNTSTTSSILGAVTASMTMAYLNNCAIVLGAVGQVIGTTNTPSGFTMIGGTVAATGSIPTILIGTSANNNKQGYYKFRDVDLSAITGTLVTVAGTNVGEIRFENCKLGAAVTMTTGAYVNTSFRVYLHNSDSSSTNYRYYSATGLGNIQSETTIVRTGSSATDGTTPLSWNLTTAANSTFGTPFVTEDISIWNNTTGSIVTITLYLISNTTLNNNDFWAEAEYAGTSSFPLGLTVNSRMTPLGTPAALTSDTSTWGGSTNKYKIVMTCTPQNKGPLKVRFYAAKASATTYIDPYIYLS